MKNQRIKEKRREMRFSCFESKKHEADSCVNVNLIRKGWRIIPRENDGNVCIFGPVLDAGRFV